MFIKVIITFFLVSFMGYLIEGSFFGRREFSSFSKGVTEKITKKDPDEIPILGWYLNHVAMIWGLVYLFAYLTYNTLTKNLLQMSLFLTCIVFILNCFVMRFTTYFRSTDTMIDSPKWSIPLKLCNNKESVGFVILYFIGILTGSFIADKLKVL